MMLLVQRTHVHKRCMRGIIFCCCFALWGFPFVPRLLADDRKMRGMLIVFAISKALTARLFQYLNPVYPSDAQTVSLLIVNLLIVL